MMEHVMMFDWCTSTNEMYFVEEADLDNCATEKILRNKFVDPLLSSDSEDDDKPNVIDWDQIFKSKPVQHSKLFVPCLRPPPHYPKVSELNALQHYQFLKILCVENPNVLEDLFIGKPCRQDFKDFELAKETYQREQKAYIEWAKTLWMTDHCIRALRPKPAVERVYESEFKVKAHRLRSFPKYYDVAAQITLENRRSNCDAVLKQDLIRVTIAEMPQVHIPDKIERHFGIIRPWTVPEPCQQHPYQIVLPNENTISTLPMTEIHRELATFALNNGTHHIASENALKCLTQWNRHWLLPISVCDTIGPDGNKANVMVLDSEFSVHKEAAPMRTYKAFRHLLESALIPLTEKERIWQIRQSRVKKEKAAPVPFRFGAKPATPDMGISDDEDSNLLVIDTGEDVEMTGAENSTGFTSPVAVFGSPNFGSPKTGFNSPKTPGYLTRSASKKIDEECPDIGLYNCTCKDTLYDKPPRRSFRKWQFRNKSTNEKYDIIIHSPHKAKDKLGELILEPLPEYQIDLGASEQTPDALRSAALSLALRKNAALLNARIDGPTGDVATFERVSTDQFVRRHPELTCQVTSTVHAALSQLQGLLPGHYVLQHEPSHGANAILMSPIASSSRHKLQLDFDTSPPLDVDEAQVAKLPPTISTALLPYHKQRKMLPCAFTPHENMVSREPKKPQPKKKPPPQAIKLQAEQPDNGARPQFPKKKSRKRRR